jgi:hypothetical protein
LTNSAAAAASDEFIADNIQLALSSTNYKQQKTRRYHILQHLAWYSLLLIFNWPLAAPAPAISKKPQGTISCLLFIAAKVQLALGCSSTHKLQETIRYHILQHLAQGRICNS